MLNRVIAVRLRVEVLALLVLFPSVLWAQANGQLQIHVINVGQGDATLIISPQGQTMLIDSGPPSASSCASPTGIITYLANIGFSRLDYYVASHYHEDHIGCIDHIAARWPIQIAAIDRGTASLPGTQVYTRYAAAVASKRQAVSVGQTITLDSGSAAPVTFQVVGVNGNGQAVSDENDRSVVLVLRFGSFDAAFGGDIAGFVASGHKDIESAVAGSIGHVEFYKVNHHGSATSSNSTLMSKLMPRVAAVSMSSTNSYGHPTQAAIDRIRATGAVTYRTTAGAGAPPIPGYDVVANGAIRFDVPAGGFAFAVSGGGFSHPYQSWGIPCTYTGTFSTAQAPPTGISGAATVTAPSGCSWSASVNVPWVTIASGASGIGNGAVAWTLAPNLGALPRTAHFTIAGTVHTLTQRGRPLAWSDFEGDRVGDVGVFRPATGEWFILGSSVGQTYVWGGGNDIPVPGDYDGDGITDAAIFRPSSSTWYIRRSTSFTMQTVSWGGPGDVPVAGDYDGDAKIDVAIYRPSTGQWFILGSLYSATYVWGGGSDIPTPGDYDGDGITDAAVFRPSTGTWHIRQSSSFTERSVVWGGAGDIPVSGDYDGDARTDVAIFRPSTGEWFVLGSTSSATYIWGGGADVPVPSDYDGDGKTDAAVFRPSQSTWYIRQSATMTMRTVVWGGTGDIAIGRRP